MKGAIIMIPHGFSNNGSWLRKAEMRQLNGYDEQYLAEIDNYPLPVRTTALLERIVKFGKAVVESDIKEIIRHLTVGDRVALILHLRRLTFGDKMQCTIVCLACKEAMSLDLYTSNLLQPAILQARSEYVIDTKNFVLTLRPVTGADQEALFEKDNNDGDDRNNNNNNNNNNAQFNESERLARSCIVSSHPPLPDKLTGDLLDITSSKLEELDPQADIVLEIRCPGCQHTFQTSFNVEDFIFQEIYSRRKQLEREVHWMAFNYHWNEDSILSLPITKRKRYVELINRTLSGESI
jgi:hypothetical protein